MAATDYYKELGVARDAEEKEIKRAYRRLARKYHPDVNPGNAKAAERFKRIATAYGVLADKKKRHLYDRFGEAGLSEGFQEGAGPTGGAGGFPGGFRGGFEGVPPFAGGGRGGGAPFGADLGDLFGQFFGGGRARPPQRGADLETEVTLTLDDAAHGSRRRITLGNGSRVDVKIPAGVDTGTRIRVTGKGQPGPGGGPTGDLFVRVRMAPHPYFRRDGQDIYLDLPLTLTEATLGTSLRIPTLDGVTQLKVPAGVASGARLRLRGKGLPGAKATGRGDQFVVIKIVPPKNLSDAARARLEEVARLAPYDPRRDLAWAEER
ncbi:MAG: hypothetical protein COW73_00765 [Nitrospirae bacterium CG18_big_fil_WC_8_21_14_2_50_70_55]|nr:DnaJ domain-containing protein [Deltaproteobacteria bacterium]OIP62515.1 MAG: hypothetical protein AUK30_10115 [Nitrospirae bacterium CG2_30_70_394]PIQ07053.1 MAG: hypothetical protein COW73_00765 [Nitrospirae bacterium CG18_big_fil_WC_8_21_14_2_50_70_55]PIU78892.1 MAG: hypothetical protein COS73_05950 [Nitrospirae bacterium CG06_land_8_20_14_3_00_70_43]PIW82358.1 MAG: hypothetical protein COZ96_09000 [Nitrospirae bacterium CG_4_8_14_3_um_filter_70_85]PIX82368.1 MAG: hypothetical protein CO